jgi:hypothetical protein
MRRSYFITTEKDAAGDWVAWAAIHDDASRAPTTGGGTAALEEEAIRIAIVSARSALQRLTVPPGPREERTTDRPPAAKPRPAKTPANKTPANKTPAKKKKKTAKRA